MSDFDSLMISQNPDKLGTIGISVDLIIDEGDWDIYTPVRGKFGLDLWGIHTKCH